MTYYTFSKCLIKYASFFGLVHKRLTPHSFRRGGATRFFAVSGSYDALATHGRWAQVRTARMYVDSAMLEAGSVSLPAWGKNRLARCNSILSNLIEANAV